MYNQMSIPASPLSGWRKLYAANVSTAGPLSASAPTTTRPTAGAVDRALGGALCGRNVLAVLFFGARSSGDNETFTARIEGWSHLGGLWIPTPLLALTLTQGTSVGVAGQDVLNTNYFADTLVADTAYTSAYELVQAATADNSIAMLKVDTAGFEIVQVRLAKGTNASANALVREF